MAWSLGAADHAIGHRVTGRLIGMVAVPERPKESCPKWSELLSQVPLFSLAW
jgi:hypothetical protein